MMNNQKQFFWNKAMLYGAILGIALSLEMLIAYFAGSYFAGYRNTLMFALLIAGSYLSAFFYRGSLPQDFPLPYGKALGFASALMIFSGFVSAISTFLVFTLDAGFVDEYLTYTEEAYLNSGFSEEMVETLVNVQSEMVNPTFLAISQFFTVYIYGFLFSLITSLFVRKKNNLSDFEQAMQNIDNNND